MNGRMQEIAEIIQELRNFRDERNWAQFHNSKDLALAISIEASELTELFLWKKSEEIEIDELKDELADVFAFAFLLADKHCLNVREIVLQKIQKNAQRYPVDMAYITAVTYNRL